MAKISNRLVNLAFCSVIVSSSVTSAIVLIKILTKSCSTVVLVQCCSHFGYVTNIVKFLLNYIFLSELDLRPCSPWDLIEVETTATGYYQPELIIDEVYVGVFSNIIIPLN